MRPLLLAALLLAAAGIARASAQQTPPQCRPAIGDQQIRHLRCLVATLDAERMQMMDQMTETATTLAMARADLARANALSDHLAAVAAYWKRWCGSARGCAVSPPRPRACATAPPDSRAVACPMRWKIRH